MDHADSPDLLIGLAAAIGALIIALAVLGLVDMDDTQQRQPLPTPAYVTRATTP